MFPCFEQSASDLEYPGWARGLCQDPARSLGEGTIDDGQPVLAAIAVTAARLCHPAEALVYRAEGDRLRLVARAGTRRPATGSSEALPIDRRTIRGRAILDGRTGRAGAAVATPMRQDGAPLGVIEVRRGKARPLSDAQVGLLETFAIQAAVSIQALDRAHPRAGRVAAAAGGDGRSCEPSRLRDRRPAGLRHDRPPCDAALRSGVRRGLPVRRPAPPLRGPPRADGRGGRGHPARISVAADRGTAAGRSCSPPPSPRFRTCSPIPTTRLAPSPRAATFRSIVAVPMIRDGTPIGGSRCGGETGAFPDRQTCYADLRPTGRWPPSRTWASSRRRKRGIVS